MFLILLLTPVLNEKKEIKNIPIIKNITPMISIAFIKK
jgi:hypothetical protein